MISITKLNLTDFLVDVKSARTLSKDVCINCNICLCQYLLDNYYDSLFFNIGSFSNGNDNKHECNIACLRHDLGEDPTIPEQSYTT